jgi:hypothetical protein
MLSEPTSNCRNTSGHNRSGTEAAHPVGGRNKAHRSPRAMRRVVSVILVFTAGVLIAVTPASPAAAESYPSDCPEMTDSITRLYQAYFLRQPDPIGFHYWTNVYQNGEASLEQISDYFFRSSEFQSRYGETSNDDFVELVYRNVLRRAPDPTGRRHWIQSLERGYSRGSLMVAFSESEEFVRRTNTRIPMAGYLRWYPEGTHWYCGTGPIQLLSVIPLAGEPLFADYLVRNNNQASGARAEAFGLYTVENGVRNVTMAEGAIDPGATDYRWDGAFAGDGFYGTDISMNVGPNTSWIVVFYPRSIGRDRLGWRLVG